VNKLGAYQKKARNIENVEARHALLLAGLKSPERVSLAVAKTLTGQRTFAALTLPSGKIEPLSLNTLKTLAGELYAKKEGANGDGFGYLDGLRGQLKQLLEDAPAGRSVAAKAKRQTAHTEGLTSQLREVELQNIRRSKAYLDLYSKLNTLIKEGTIEETTRLRLFKILENHHALYGPLFNPQGPQSNGDGALVLKLPVGKED
jgi:hypothetical protein